MKQADLEAINTRLRGATVEELVTHDDSEDAVILSFVDATPDLLVRPVGDDRELELRFLDGEIQRDNLGDPPSADISWIGDVTIGRTVIRHRPSGAHGVVLGFYWSWSVGDGAQPGNLTLAPETFGVGVDREFPIDECEVVQ